MSDWETAGTVRLYNGRKQSPLPRVATKLNSWIKGVQFLLLPKATEVVFYVKSLLDKTVERKRFDWIRGWFYVL